MNLFKQNKTQDLDDISCTAIIVAAGNGERMNSSLSKQFIHIFDRPIISYTIEMFQNCEMVCDIIIVTKEADILEMNSIVKAFDFTKVSKIVSGGDSRQQSVYKGLLEVDNDTSLVAVHDGARPFVLIDDIKGTLRKAKEFGAAATAVKLKDTIKETDGDQFVTNTPDRSKLWAIGTPQCFEYDLIMRAYENANMHNVNATDDCALAEKIGVKVKLVEGSYENIKITTPEDIIFAKAILESRGENN